MTGYDAWKLASPPEYMGDDREEETPDDEAEAEADGPGDAAEAAEPIADLIARSSIGAALADIKERGIDAHLADLESPRRKR